MNCIFKYKIAGSEKKFTDPETYNPTTPAESLSHRPSPDTEKLDNVNSEDTPTLCNGITTESLRSHRNSISTSTKSEEERLS